MVLYCSDCGTDREFDRPPCVDCHGMDCPEYACVECGYAILLGDAEAAEQRRAARHVA